MKKNKKVKLRKELEWYSFIVLPLLTVMVLVYWPMMESVLYSFTDTDSLANGIGRFVGLNNYRQLLFHSSFMKSVANTLILAFLNLTAIPLGFLLANMLNGLGRGKLQGFFRVSFYLPHIISGVSVVMILQIVLKGNHGVFNEFLSWILHREISIGWLSDLHYAKIGATLISVWSGLGYNILINLASLQAIPQELYDAASVDGAGVLKRCRYITVPNMRYCFFFLFITSMINGMSRFTDLYMIGGNTSAGSPAGSLQTIMMYIYQYSFEKLEYGVSSAGAMILFVLTFILTMFNVKLTGFLKDE